MRLITFAVTVYPIGREEVAPPGRHSKLQEWRRSVGACATRLHASTMFTEWCYRGGHERRLDGKFGIHGTRNAPPSAPVCTPDACASIRPPLWIIGCSKSECLVISTSPCALELRRCRDVREDVVDSSSQRHRRRNSEVHRECQQRAAETGTGSMGIS